jgi:Domain of unknown function (DUF4032)/Lipopolysaccharide kinase (Kdo/WaaP) family
MRFRVANSSTYPAGLVLPWDHPLETWAADLFVDVARGLSRNLVRFVEHCGSVYAIKELLERVAAREYHLLRSLTALDLPVVEPVGIVTERLPVTTDSGAQEQMALLVTRYLAHSLPFRTVISGGVSVEQANHLLDALAELLVTLHLAGFFWGDVSLSNALFRRDAGRFSAYLVDAETGELRPQLSNGQRAHDLAIAEENVAGEFMDLAAGYGLPAGLDPGEAAARLVSRYEELWVELNREDVFSAQEQYLIDRRIQRLNALGFDVEELDIETIDAGHRIRMRAKVVEPGHHRRLLQSLTGLDVEENQARTLLNDLYRFRAWHAGIDGHPVSDEVAAYRWLNEVYRPTLERIDPELRRRLDDAEIFHQILEHRWYMSERAGHDMPLERVVPSYVEQVLAALPEPPVAEPPPDSRA